MRAGLSPVYPSFIIEDLIPGNLLLQFGDLSVWATQIKDHYSSQCKLARTMYTVVSNNSGGGEG